MAEDLGLFGQRNSSAREQTAPLRTNKHVKTPHSICPSPPVKTPLETVNTFPYLIGQHLNLLIKATLWGKVTMFTFFSSSFLKAEHLPKDGLSLLTFASNYIASRHLSII